MAHSLWSGLRFWQGGNGTLLEAGVSGCPASQGGAFPILPSLWVHMTDDAGNSTMAGSHSVLHSHRRLGTERGCTGPCWPSCVLTRGTESPYQVGCSSSAWLFIIPADEGDGAFKVPALSIPLVRSWVLTQKTHRLYSQPSCSWAGWYLRFPC